MTEWRRSNRFILSPLLVFALGLLLGCPAQPPESDPVSDAATVLPATLGSCPINQPLQQPHVISGVGDGATLDTTLVARKVLHTNVPIVSGSGDNCTLESVELRSYGYPVSPGSTDLEFAIPGPTLLANMTYLQDPTQDFNPTTNPETKKGSRLRILLENDLPASTIPPHDCEPIVYWACEDSLRSCTGGDPWTCPDDDTKACVEKTFPQESPNCFHGPEVTNLHYHGSHVSPQPHQDFVLLELYSSQQPDPPQPNGYDIAVGQYQTDIPQLPWRQPPGTHWYHPHKHGSTATQVGSGMAGALVIEGPFDEWLNDEYGIATAEQSERFDKLLVVHQITEAPPFFTQVGATPPYPLVNGQLIPQVTMQQGEIQRWRFVGATMNGSAQLDIRFPAGFVVKQIAQDGVQFAPENYLTTTQPFTKLKCTDPDTGDSSDPVDGSCPEGTVPDYYWTLSPGNRIDFLVKAPATSGTFRMSQRMSGHQPPIVQERLQRRAAGIRSRLNVPLPRGTAAGQTFEEVLFAINVTTASNPMDFPTTWPPTPAYLSDIDSVNNYKTAAYSMTGNQGSLPNAFFINDSQFDGSCAALSQPPMVLGEAGEWTVTNSSGPQHPHHIHVSPFQLRSSPDYPNVAANGAPYPWMDTIALPAGSTSNVTQVVLRQRYRDYSGAFVIHCHFLAHEDRGMMKVVQTVCPSDIFGTPQPDGLPDDCSIPSSDYPPELNPYPPCSDQ